MPSRALLLVALGSTLACTEPSDVAAETTGGAGPGATGTPEPDSSGGAEAESTSTSGEDPEMSSSGAEVSDHGSGSSGGDDPTTTTGLDPADVLFEEDFESAAADTVPPGWDSFVGYVVNMNNDPGGAAFALADGTRAHGGAQALHVLGGSSPAMLTRPLPAGLEHVYVRAYVWSSVQLGQNPGHNHETLLGVRGSVGQANEEVRFGEIKGVIGTNEVPSDDISPTMESWGRGPVVEAERWNCIEVAFLADPDANAVVAWRDGEEIHRVDDPSQWNNGGALGPNFLDGKFNEFILGWHSFSDVTNELWIDDVFVATGRVGCD